MEHIDKTSIKKNDFYVFDLENYERVRPGFFTYQLKGSVFGNTVLGKYNGKSSDNKFSFVNNGVPKSYSSQELNGKLNFTPNLIIY